MKRCPIYLLVEGMTIFQLQLAKAPPEVDRMPAVRRGAVGTPAQGVPGNRRSPQGAICHFGDSWAPWPGANTKPDQAAHCGPFVIAKAWKQLRCPSLRAGYAKNEPATAGLQWRKNEEAL